jgi:hypothetical protein
MSIKITKYDIFITSLPGLNLWSFPMRRDARNRLSGGKD